MTGAEATRDFFLQLNGLAGAVPVNVLAEDLDTADRSTAERFDYAGDAPVRWWRLNGAGHPLASRLVKVDPSPATGYQNRDIEFAEEAWAFFAARLPD